MLRFLPPFILGKDDVDNAIDALDSIFTEHAPQTAGAASDGRQTRWLATLILKSESQAGVLPSPAEALAGRDFCSIADFSTAEIAAVMELAHDGEGASRRSIAGRSTQNR